MTTMAGPPQDPTPARLRSIAKSIEPAFPTAAETLRGIAADAHPNPEQAVRDARAEAWDEGYKARAQWARHQNGPRTPYPNPYHDAHRGGVRCLTPDTRPPT